MTTSGPPPRNFHPFVPALGPLEHRLYRLSRQLTGTGLDVEVVEGLAREAEGDWRGNRDSERKLRWALALSILSDILVAGGTIHCVDSSLHVAWPDWSSEEGARGLRRALERLRDEMRYGHVTPEVIDVLPASMTRDAVTQLISEGAFELREAEDSHPSGVLYGDVFAAARRYWTMPHRDREGRNRRYVLTVTHPSQRWPLPAGILEVGDPSMLARDRDAALGLTAPTFNEWLATPAKARDRLTGLEARLLGLHGALKPIPGVRISRSSYENQFDSIPSLEHDALGRSKSEEDHTTKKRKAYLARLLRSLRAVAAWRAGSEPQSGDTSAVVRAVRDLTVPRVTLELTLCGALPPFSRALVGKLVVAFAGDPRIRGICSSEPGQIMASVFEVAKLQEHLPTDGAILLTTKGLFPHHSAQYTRAELPREHSDLRVQMRKIGMTTGITASLMSKRTYRLARAFLALPFQRRTVAGIFGSGGSKRQRRIEAAVISLGLPEAIIHPRLQRPVYAAELALNLRDVCILNERPRFSVSTSGARSYAREAQELWRSHWLPTARRRLTEGDRDVITGVRQFIGESGLNATR